MKKLTIIIIAVLAISFASAQDTTMTVLKPKLVLVEIQVDSVTSNDFLFKKKDAKAEIKRCTNTINAVKARRTFLQAVIGKMNDE